MREVFKEGFGVGLVLENNNGTLKVKWSDSKTTTTINESEVTDVLLS